MRSEKGPLHGVRVIELAGLGPAPFCGMMLADHGADVIRVDRPATVAADPDSLTRDVLNRSRRGIAIDLKRAEGVALVRRMCASADGIIEGYRPGVMERLGLGPELLLGDNPQLVYGRMTGWGQTGPLAAAAGHDINYIALSGALHAIGEAGGKPVPPLNLIGDFGGGGMMLAFGMVAAILHARASGQGQVVDCAMTEGSAMLMAMMYSFRAEDRWNDERGTNMLDSGAYFYGTYETADGLYVALGPVEPQFHHVMLERIGLAEDPAFARQNDAAGWPALKERLARHMRSRTRAEWCALLEGSDACFAPVLSMAEAPQHSHNRARNSFVTVDGAIQPAPAPRYSMTSTVPPRPLSLDPGFRADLLGDLGYPPGEAERLTALGVIA